MPACPSCSTENAVSARFCSECGTSLEALCPECANPLPTPQAKFCPSCGARLVKDDEASHMLKLVTILFADVVSSTRRAEQMHAEDIRELMTDFFDEMTEEIRQHGGRIEKFIGDAVMAVFGVPAAREDDPLRAVRAARGMLMRLEQWNEGREPLHQIQIRIGVNTGDVLAAGPGSDLMVTGDAVNVAARLEQAAAAGTVVVGQRTARAVRPFFVLKEIEPLSLKGKAEPVPAFLVEDEKEVVEPRGVPGLFSPLVGRDEEIMTLHTALQRVEDEHSPHLVTVIADPGAGKSRLLREFSIAIETSAKVVQGRCLPYGQGVTLWPFGEILKAETGLLETDPAELAFEKIGKLVKTIPSEIAGDRDRTTAALASTLGLSDPSGSFTRLDPRERFRELLSAWRALLLTMALDAPLVVVVDDIHWADPTMLEVLENLVADLDAPVLFLCPTRPDLFSTHPQWGADSDRHSSLTLTPLTSDESALLVEQLLNHAELPRQLHQRILDRSEGNPFFIEEILHRLIDEGHLVQEAGTWNASGDIADVEIPDNVQAVILARIDLLTSAQKQVIQNAAVMGRSFWPGALQRLDIGDVEGILSHLEQRQLVFKRPSTSMAGEAEYMFKHILIRDVAYETLPRKRRAKSHVAAAEWVKDVSGERAEGLAELLAHHYHMAFDYSKDDDLRKTAREFYCVASRKSCERFAVEQSEKYGYLAVDLSKAGEERVDALERLGDVYVMSFGMDGAWKVYKDALKELNDGGGDNRTRYARLSAKAALVPTRWESSIHTAPEPQDLRRLIKTGLAAAGSRDSRERAQLLVSKAVLQAVGYEPMDESGERAAREALAVAERLNDPDLISSAVDAVNNWLLADARYGAIYKTNARRLQLIPQLSDVKEICDAYIVAAWSSFFIGRYADAAKYATLCVEQARGVDPGSYLLGTQDRVAYRFMTGDWDGALEDQREVERLEGDGSEKLPAPHAWSTFAYALLIRQLRGDDQEARKYEALLNRFDAQVEVTQREAPTIRAAIFSRALNHRGQSRAAQGLLRLEPGAAFCIHLETACDVAAALQDWAQAEDVIFLSQAESARAELLALPCYVDRLAARKASAVADYDLSASLLRKSAEGFSGLGAVWEEAMSRLLLGEVLLRQQADDAVKELSSAFATFSALRSVRETERVVELLSLVRS